MIDFIFAPLLLRRASRLVLHRRSWTLRVQQRAPRLSAARKPRATHIVPATPSTNTRLQLEELRGRAHAHAQQLSRPSHTSSLSPSASLSPSLVKVPLNR